MHPLAPLTALISAQIETVTNQLKRQVIVSALLGLLLTLAAIFAIAAGFIALAAQTNALIACLIFSVGALVLALLVYLGGVIVRRAQKRRADQRQRAQQTNSMLTATAISAAPMLLSHPLGRKFGLPLAAIAAFYMLTKSDDTNSND